MRRVNEMKNKERINFEDYSFSFNNSKVENILISDCLLKADSSDQIGHLSSAKDKAKYGLSLGCGESLDALDKKPLNLSSGIKLISSSIKRTVSSNSPKEILDNCIILSLFTLNSCNMKCGETSSVSRFNNSSINLLLVESFLKNEKSMLASTINLEKCGIFYQPCFLTVLSFASDDNLFICSSVNLDFDMISSITENLTLLVNCSTTFSNAVSNFPASSGGTSTLILISAINGDNCLEYINFSGEGDEFSLAGNIIEKAENFVQEIRTKEKLK